MATTFENGVMPPAPCSDIPEIKYTRGVAYILSDMYIIHRIYGRQWHFHVTVNRTMNVGNMLLI